MPETRVTPLGLYVHWPYCAAICPYCDFNVYRAGKVDADIWTSALAADIRYWAKRVERRPLTSIYFGGGTPSLAPVSVIASVIETVARNFSLTDDCEITLEANPNDANEPRMRDLADAGVNRLSLGVQSFDDGALAFLGRNHDSAAAKRAIETASRIFTSTTFDLIYGRPNQTEDDWHAELNAALEFRPLHLSLYQLTIEPGTAFAQQVIKGRWTPASDDMQARHYEIAQALTAEAGLAAYEVSNYAAAGSQSRHNLIYWRYHDYIGVGPGAHGRLVIDGKRVATKAVDRPGDYLARVGETGAGAETIEALSEDAQLMERLSMGLRLAEGVTLYADDYFYRDDKRAAQLRRLIDDGFLTHECGRLRATDLGRPVLNRLLYELLG